MRLTSDSDTAWTRVDESEVAALRMRLGIAKSDSRESRGHGFATTSDVAEAFGISVDAVEAQLRAIRAEHAFIKPKTSRSQIGLAILALFMFAIAAEIYHLRQPKTMEQILEEEAQAVQDAKLHRPKRIHYPVEYKMDLTGVLPAAFAPIEIDGQYTKTSATTRDTAAMSRSAATAALSGALKKVLAEAASNEAHVKKPEKPAQTKPGDPFAFNKPTPWSMQIRVGNSFTEFLIAKPPAGSPQSFQYQGSGAPVPSLDEQAESLAESTVRGAWASQQNTLTMDPGTVGYPAGSVLPPPPGFNYQTKTMQIGQGYSGGSGGVLLPLDESLVARQLSRCLSSLVDSFSRPPEGFFAQPETKPVPKPQFDDVTLSGPLEKRVFHFPVSPSAQFPNAAAVWRGSHRLIDQAAAWAKDQVRRLNGNVRE